KHGSPALSSIRSAAFVEAPDLRQRVDGKAILALSQKTVERVIGRLLTDEELRLTFVRAPKETLQQLLEQGWELNRAEVDALLSTDIRLWAEVAKRIDTRLQRCSLSGTEEANE